MLYEIIRNLRPGGYDYAWYRVKEMFLVISSQAGVFLSLVLLSGAGMWVATFVSLSLITWLIGVDLAGKLSIICLGLSLVWSIPMSIKWFRGLCKIATDGT